MDIDDVLNFDMSIEIEEAIEEGFDPNTRLPNGNTLLIAALQHNAKMVMRALLANGANPNLSAEDGTPPILIAAHESDVDMLVELLRAGANPNAQDRKGMTALMLAVLTDSPEKVRVLLRAGADMDLTVDLGHGNQTVFDLIARERRLHNREEIMDMLLTWESRLQAAGQVVRHRTGVPGMEGILRKYMFRNKRV